MKRTCPMPSPRRCGAVTEPSASSSIISSPRSRSGARASCIRTSAAMIPRASARPACDCVRSAPSPTFACTVERHWYTAGRGVRCPRSSGASSGMRSRPDEHPLLAPTGRQGYVSHAPAQRQTPVLQSGPGAGRRLDPLPGGRGRPSPARVPIEHAGATLHELAQLKELGLAFHPDVVVVGFFYNDVELSTAQGRRLARTIPAAAGPPSLPRRVWSDVDAGVSAMQHRSLLYAWVASHLGAAIRQLGAKGFGQVGKINDQYVDTNQNWQLTRVALLEMKLLCEQRDIRASVGLSQSRAWTCSRPSGVWTGRSSGSRRPTGIRMPVATASSPKPSPGSWSRCSGHARSASRPTQRAEAAPSTPLGAHGGTDP